MIPAMARRRARRRGDSRCFCNFWGGTVSGTTSRTAGPERGRALLPDRFVSEYAAFLGGRLGMIRPNCAQSNHAPGANHDYGSIPSKANPKLVASA